MKAMLISLLFVCVATLAVAHNRRRRLPLRSWPGCDPHAAPYGCWKTPADRDAMDLNVFREKISGKVDNIVWLIDAIGFRKENIFPSFRPNKAYQLVGIDTLRLGFKFRTSAAPNATCLVVRAGTDVKDGRIISRTKAIWDIDFTFDKLGANTYRVWLMSEQPDAYGIYFWCRNSNAIQYGLCNNRWFVQITIDPERMNNPPMHNIVDELYRKLGLRFDDPRNTFRWEGYECPGALL